MEYRPSMASRRGAQVRVLPDTEALLKEIDDLKRESAERKDAAVARMAKARAAKGRKRR